jgi:hypothetical protein
MGCIMKDNLSLMLDILATVCESFCETIRECVDVGLRRGREFDLQGHYWCVT